MNAFVRALVVPVSVLICIVACPRGLSAQITLTQTFCVDAQHPCVWTYHNDNSRGGVNPNETVFTPSYLQQGHTFFATTYPTDGLIYAQPLYNQGTEWQQPEGRKLPVACRNGFRGHRE
jgi:hypothetical protein